VPKSKGSALVTPDSKEGCALIPFITFSGTEAGGCTKYRVTLFELMQELRKKISFFPYSLTMLKIQESIMFGQSLPRKFTKHDWFANLAAS
jgi:hypothetical protein